MLPVYLDGERDPAATPDPEAGESAPKSLLAAALLAPGALIECGKAPVALAPAASWLPAELAKLSDSAIAVLNA